jgi:hypothetical protein
MTCATGASEPTTMRSTLRSRLRLPLCCLIVGGSMVISATSALAQQAAAPARPAQTPTPAAETPPPSPSATTFAQSRRAALPQGFSVVLVLGDIQGAPMADDVPPAARKALVDMREFLPFKSYKLLDAAWVMCCGLEARPGARGLTTSWTGGYGGVSQLLRGPEDQEYELKLSTSRGDTSQIFVRFTLLGSSMSREVLAESVSAASAGSRTTARHIADLRDQRLLLEKQIQEAKKKYEVGVAPGDSIAKLEVELRRVEREIEDLTAGLAEGHPARSAARGGAESALRSSIIDTSFTMDVGETVVVGTSRLKGGSRALIALLTAVPPRGATERKE